MSSWWYFKFVECSRILHKLNASLYNVRRKKKKLKYSLFIKINKLKKKKDETYLK